jgi:hypothetical protein
MGKSAPTVNRASRPVIYPADFIYVCPSSSDPAQIAAAISITGKPFVGLAVRHSF